MTLEVTRKENGPKHITPPQSERAGGCDYKSTKAKDELLVA